jgi:hypothetical protein
MKAFVRISLLFLTVCFAALMPFVWNHRDQIKSFSKSSKLPIGGRVYQVSGQEPTPADGLVLRAPDLCQVGELVRLDLRDSTVDGIVWQIIPNSPDFEVIEDGKRAFFSSREPGSFMFLIAGARGGVPFLVHHIVTVEGNAAPGPGPQPDGPTLEAKVGGWLKKVADYPNRKAHLAGMAGVFTKMAEAPDVKVEQILEATALANTAVLGKDLEKWVPFLDELGHELDALVAGGKLTTREQYRGIWLQIAKALETASK